MRIDKKKILINLAIKGLNQKEFADLTGMSRGNLSTIVNGKSCKPETIIKIAKALNVSINDLVED